VELECGNSPGGGFPRFSSLDGGGAGGVKGSNKKPFGKIFQFGVRRGVAGVFVAGKFSWSRGRKGGGSQGRLRSLGRGNSLKRIKAFHLENTRAIG